MRPSVQQSHLQAHSNWQGSEQASGHHHEVLAPPTTLCPPTPPAASRRLPCKPLPLLCCNKPDPPPPAAPESACCNNLLLAFFAYTSFALLCCGPALAGGFLVYDPDVPADLLANGGPRTGMIAMNNTLGHWPLVNHQLRLVTGGVGGVRL
jgi:hypothetical protein